MRTILALMVDRADAATDRFSAAGRTAMKWCAGIILVVLSVSASGCFAPDPKSLSSDSAVSAVPAIKDAADSDDRKAIPRLVQDLDDHDPAIRFAAIQGLERLTGQTFGYQYYESDDQRRPSVLLWHQWLEHQQTGPAVAATQPR